MGNVFLIIAILTAGVSLATGLISLFTALDKRDEKTDLVFGILALSIFIFLMMPPLGFVLVDKAPYPASLEVKRLFIFLYYILLPWFFELYTGHKNRILALTISSLFIGAYVAMLFAGEYKIKPLWYFIVLVAWWLIFICGVQASVRQMKSTRRKRGRWLLSAVVIYGLLLSVGTFDQLSGNMIGKLIGTNTFFPFHLHVLAFLVIMGIRLRGNMIDKYKLEQLLHWKDLRWNTLVQNMQLIILELDRTAHITYINSYGVTMLGWKTEIDVLGKNWFDYFIPGEVNAARKTLFLEAMRDGKVLPFHVAEVLCRDGKKRFINWTNVFIYDNSGVNGMMSIGMDITDSKQAFEQVQTLTIELEKENLLLKGQSLAEMTEDDIIGQSEAIRYAIQKARQVAVTNAAVLLEGETGVGKELFANLIHKYSYRSNKPLIKLNCATLPAELIESELFGHEKGSFTGAVQSRKGRFELADGGTIFLDEIGELPFHLQSKLLRVLQNGEFQRIGGQETIKVDVRVISATNRDLVHEVKSHRFREDLYYRLNVYPITIPPLRNRKEDIPALVAHFIKKLSDDHHKRIENISKGDMIRLTEYPWPGNVRELVNLMERSIISTKSTTLVLEWLHTNGTSLHESEVAQSMEEMEKAHILKILSQCKGKINGADGAAMKLGLNPNTLRSRMKKLNISRVED